MLEGTQPQESWGIVGLCGACEDEVEMIQICSYCNDSVVVSGPRNRRVASVCPKPRCRAAALLELASEDMLDKSLADELNEYLNAPHILLNGDSSPPTNTEK